MANLLARKGAEFCDGMAQLIITDGSNKTLQTCVYAEGHFLRVLLALYAV